MLRSLGGKLSPCPNVHVACPPTGWNPVLLITHLLVHILLMYMCTWLFVSSCQATKVLIRKYLATRMVVVSVGGGNGSERQLLTSLLHVP